MTFLKYWHRRASFLVGAYRVLFKFFVNISPGLFINGALLFGLGLFFIVLADPRILATAIAYFLKTVPYNLLLFLKSFAVEVGAELWSSASPLGACTHLIYDPTAAEASAAEARAAPHAPAADYPPPPLAPAGDASIHTQFYMLLLGAVFTKVWGASA